MKGGEEMVIYAVAMTALCIFLLALYLKWRIATKAVVLFCKEKFRNPTEKEIADYSKMAIGKMFKIN